MNMQHLTLNTGHCATREPVAPEIIRAIAPLCARGGPIPGFPSFSAVVGHGPGAASLSIHRDRDWISFSIVVWTPEAAEAAWREIEALYLKLSDREPELIAATASPEMPALLPWVSTVLLPGFATQRGEDIAWISDFEGCMAWALMEAAVG